MADYYINIIPSYTRCHLKRSIVGVAAVAPVQVRAAGCAREMREK